MPEHHHPTFLEAVRREWWIPLTVMLLAGLISAAVSSANPEPLYEGTALLSVDSPTLSKFPDLPRVDYMLREITGDEFASVIASRTLVASDTILAELRASTRDDPPRQLVITFRSSDKAEASTVTSAAAGYAAVRAAELGGKEIYELQRRVTETQRALKEVQGIRSEAGRNADETFRLSSAGTQWEMRMRLYEDSLALRTLRNAYYYNGNLDVQDVAPVRRRGATILGALIFGLVLGLVIAVFREALLSRPPRRSVAE
ncbi:MAG: hypothetical protein CVT66_02325 [Actinobacteria bacterium HGW-Actinobacteria-6]|nr:MAG: hypothetical protein CVT66_02325 [Actinobacteria bacterium HGW-Actinobacteria-6]